MTWEERLQPAAYTAAGRQRIPFAYRDLSTAFELFGTEFNYPDGSGSYIQRTGWGARRFPMEIIINGPDHDLVAEEFEKSLAAPGVGVLEHPIKGRMRVVPFGVVERDDRLTTAANQTVIRVAFWRVDGIEIPTNSAASTSLTQQALAAYAANAAEQLQSSIYIDTATARASLESTNSGLLGQAVAGLERIARASKNVNYQFDAVVESINESINVLVGDPLTLGFQTVIALQAPARAAASISDRMEAYGNLARSIVTQGLAVSGFDDVPSNNFHMANLYASTYVTGQVVTALNSEFTTRKDAVLAAEAILSLLDEVTNWREDNYTALGQVDTGGDLQQLQESVASVASYLVELSFSLKQEKRVTLTHARTPIDLCAELYGKVDEVLQFFIDTNNLSWQEHIEIMAGRRIVYYV